MNVSTAQELKTRTPDHRILALDSIRGIAAGTVVLFHLRLAFRTDDPSWYLRPVFAGHAAVILFFVLSGFVLALPYWHNKQQSYGQYLIRRFFRIYVPYLAALGLALLGSSCLHDARLPLTPWFYSTWHSPITLRLVLRHLFFIPHEAELNTAFWSLKYEFEMSILFPGLCWVMLRTSGWWTLATAFAMDLGAFAVTRSLPTAALAPEIRRTLLYNSCFLYGALLSQKRGRVRALFHGMPVALKIAALAAVILLYYGHEEGLLPLAACGILVFVENSRARRWLESAVPEYLGRISYSLYLTHGTLLFALLIGFYGKMPNLLLGAVFLVLSVAVAHLFCISVEEPLLRLGRRLTPKRAVAVSGVRSDARLERERTF